MLKRQDLSNYCLNLGSAVQCLRRGASLVVLSAASNTALKSLASPLAGAERVQPAAHHDAACHRRRGPLPHKMRVQ